MSLKIKKSSIIQGRLRASDLIYMLLVFVTVFPLVRSNISGIDTLNYISHCIVIMLGFMLIRASNDVRFKRIFAWQKICQWGIFFVGVLALLVVPIIHYDIPFSIGGYVKGMLNYFRYIIFFFACVRFLKPENLKSYEKLIEVIFVVNFFIVIYQYFVQGYSQDTLGGIFGTLKGGNTGLNVFCCLTTAFVCVRYFQKKTNMILLGSVLVINMIEAALAELKIFYIEAIVIVVILLLIYRPGRKILMVLMVAALSLVVGLRVFKQVFPGWYENIVTGAIVDIVFSPDTGYSSRFSHDLSRFGMFGQLEERVYAYYPITKYIGFGLGSFDPSSRGAVIQKYSELHANWFGNSIILLNSGYIGLILYYSFLIKNTLTCFSWNRALTEENYAKEWNAFGLVMLVVSILLMWYNASLMIEMSAYWLYFCMAVPFVAMKSNFDYQ